MGTLTYLKTLLKDRDVASVTPTSGYSVRRLCSRINFSRAELIVEYGPGLGAFTKYLLDRMPVNSRLIAVEKNRGFYSKLKKKFKDPRLTVVHNSAEEILKIVPERSVDYVISGIPFSMIPLPEKKEILESTAKVLREDGRFLTYQFFPPPASMDNFLRKPLEEYFHLVWKQYEFRNIPPLRIYDSKPKDVVTLSARSLYKVG